MNLDTLLVNLKNSLDQDDDIIEIKKIQNKISGNKELLNKIKYNEDINNDSDIRMYKHLENRINYKILSINKKLKEITGDRKWKSFKENIKEEY